MSRLRKELKITLKIWILLGLLIFSASPVQAGLGRWTSLGPYPQVWDLAVDPQNPSTVYIACPCNHWGALYRSTDSGSTWVDYGSDQIWRVLVDPQDSILYAIGDNVLKKVGSGGWGGASQGLGDYGTTALAIDPVNNQVLYAGCQADGMYKTTNGAVWWFRSSDGLPGFSFSTWVQGIAISPDSREVVYIIIQGDVCGLFRTTNGGQDWEYVSLGGERLRSLAVDPQDCNTVYVGKWKGLWKNTDGGHGEWNQILPDVIPHEIEIDPLHPDTLFLACESVMKTTDGGESWEKIGDIDYLGAVHIAINPRDADTIYTGSSGASRTFDGGKHWEYFSEGIGPIPVAAIACDPKNEGVLLAGAGTLQGVFRSPDGGHTWTHNGLGSQVDELAIAPNDPDIMFLGNSTIWIESRMYKSTDNGLSWSHVDGFGTSPGQLVIAIDPYDSDIVYAVGGSPGGLYKSTDCGQTWWGPANGGGGEVIIIDREQPTILYAGGIGVFKSTDAGSTWFPSSQGMPEDTWTTALAINPKITDIIYAGTRREDPNTGTVYKTTNAGTTWTEAGNRLPNVWITSLSINPDTTEVIYAGTWKEGVFKSTDEGESWSEMNEGLPIGGNNDYPTIKALAIDPFDHRTIYIGTHFHYLFKCGVFAYTDTTLHGVKPTPENILPKECALSQNYPNPFNSNTAISYQLPGVRPHRTTLKVYNIAGRRVRTLIDAQKEPGSYRVCWNGTDDRGRPVASGVYFYRLKAGEFTQVKRMLLLR